MADPKIVDLLAELRKARVVLAATQTHLHAQAQVTAALHCSDVRQTPLYSRVAGAITHIDHTLARIETKIGNGTAPVPRRVNRQLAEVLLDLDRCTHGRHSVENCFGCPTGQSVGNLLLPAGTVIGHGHRGVPIIVPPVEDRDDWTAWRRPPMAKGGER